MVCVPVCVNKKQLKGMMEGLIDKNKSKHWILEIGIEIGELA